MGGRRHLQNMHQPLLTELTELVGKQKERHARMAKDLHQMVTIERVLAIMDRLGTLVREHVTDMRALQVIQAGTETLIVGPD